MLVTIAVILILVWLAGLLLFKTLGAIIHIALIVGLVLLAVKFLRGRGSA
jgi:hypothetical protein